MSENKQAVEWITKAAKELFDDAAGCFPMNGDIDLESHLKDIERIKLGFSAIITRHAEASRQICAHCGEHPLFKCDAETIHNKGGRNPAGMCCPYCDFWLTRCELEQLKSTPAEASNERLRKAAEDALKHFESPTIYRTTAQLEAITELRAALSTPPQQEGNDPRIEGLKHALAVCQSKRHGNKKEAYLCAVDEIAICLEAAIERVQSGERMESTAVVQSKPLSESEVSADPESWVCDQCHSRVTGEGFPMSDKCFCTEACIEKWRANQ